jgi:hypothetical protein
MARYPNGLEENGDDHILDAMKYVISWHTKVFRLS